VGTVDENEHAKGYFYLTEVVFPTEGVSSSNWNLAMDPK
jgi:hypothetical protein